MKVIAFISISLLIGIVLRLSLKDNYTSGLIVGSASQFTYWLLLTIYSDKKIKSK